MFLQDALLIAGIGGGLLAAGYWLSARMPEITAAERATAGFVAGLASLILMVSVIGSFRPISGLWAWLCLLPCGVTLGHALTRKIFIADCRQLFARSEIRWIAAIGAAFLALLLAPLLDDPNLVFYDGTANHDNFFWIAGGEHLQTHHYLAWPTSTSTAKPFANKSYAIAGWRPAWGRMGTEGLLALTSSIRGLPIVNLYTVATAALYLPWLAGVFLLLRTFVSERPSFFVLAIGASVQPLFVFFHSNANLPNLLGALVSAGIVVGLQRWFVSVHSGSKAWPWWGIAMLSTHGLLCVYPEMFPFVLLPCGLLLLRGLKESGLRCALLAGAALVAGMIVNPATAVRAFHGLVASYGLARANESWTNIFAPVHPEQYLLAVTTLAIAACVKLGLILGTLLSFLVVTMVVFALRRARDPFGTAALFSGTAVLVLYTVITSFSYGWQKSAQFAGLFIGALFPAGCIAAMERRRAGPIQELAARLVTGIVILCYGWATLQNCFRTYNYPARKGITREMLSLRTYSARDLYQAPVLVVAESFQRPFFYGMWASYLFPESSLFYSARDKMPAGYLHDSVQIESLRSTPKPVAVFVSEEWAATFDLMSRRLKEGKGFALLENTNRVVRCEGFEPKEGVPRSLSTKAVLELLPYRDAWLHMIVRPRDTEAAKNVYLRVERRSEPNMQAVAEVRLEEGPPWNIVLPLKGAALNAVEFVFGGALPSGDFPFRIDLVRITNE